MEPTANGLQKLVEVIQGGGAAALAGVSLIINYILWGALKEERIARNGENKERLADQNTAAEKMLKMAEQNADIARAANATTITNTAAIEASRLAIEKTILLNERILLAAERAGGK